MKQFIHEKNERNDSDVDDRFFHLDNVINNLKNHTPKPGFKPVISSYCKLLQKIFGRN